jgi:hypothetical protein
VAHEHQRDDIFKSKGLSSPPCADDSKDAVGYFKARFVLVIGIGPNTRLHLRLHFDACYCVRLFTMLSR